MTSSKEIEIRNRMKDFIDYAEEWLSGYQIEYVILKLSALLDEEKRFENK